MMSPRQADAWNHRTLDEFVHHYCPNPRLATLVGFATALAFVLPPWEISAGEAIHCLQRTARDNTLGYPLGGSRAVPTTYCRLAQEMGAQVLTRAHVRRIIIEHGHVRGVELRDGTRIDADLVISTSSVRTTASHLCDPGVLPDDYTAGARNITGSQTAVQVEIALDRKLVDTGLLVGMVSDITGLMQTDRDTIAEMFRQNAGGRVPDIRFVYCPVPTNYARTSRCAAPFRHHPYQGPVCRGMRRRRSRSRHRTRSRQRHGMRRAPPDRPRPAPAGHLADTPPPQPEPRPRPPARGLRRTPLRGHTVRWAEQLQFSAAGHHRRRTTHLRLPSPAYVAPMAGHRRA